MAVAAAAKSHLRKAVALEAASYPDIVEGGTVDLMARLEKYEAHQEEDVGPLGEGAAPCTRTVGCSTEGKIDWEEAGPY